ncbi:hypothetical protein [Simkania sp.]|uniref:hypothetical protein n=1 Tax=Simkania sp. TaxID=34094 RepID=UPI003B516958
MSISTFISARHSQIGEMQHVAHQENARRLDSAIQNVGELRDLNHLKSDFAADVKSSFNKLFKSPQEYIQAREYVQLFNEDPQKVLYVSSIMGLNISETQERTMDMNARVADADILINSLPARFEAFVAEKEEAAQDQLKVIAEIQGKDPKEVEAELEHLGRIPKPINPFEDVMRVGTEMQNKFAATSRV